MKLCISNLRQIILLFFGACSTILLLLKTPELSTVETVGFANSVLLFLVLYDLVDLKQKLNEVSQ